MSLKRIIKKILHTHALISFARRYVVNDEWHALEEQFSLKEKAFFQAQERIREQETLLVKKDNTIRRKNAVIENFRKTILERNSLLKEKDSVISRKNAVIEDFRKTILERNSLLKEKDSVISKKNAVIEDSQKTILTQKMKLDTNETRILEQEQMIGRLQSDLQNQKQLLQDKENSRNMISRLASWSQAGEDRIIANAFHTFCGLQSIDGLFYIDIGGNDPVRDNNTRYLYRRKGNGIVLEPNHELAEKFHQIRPRDIVLEAGISFSTALDHATYYNFGPRFSGYNTFSKERAEHILHQKHLSFQTEEKKLISLPTLWETYCEGEDVHLFFLDVEGLEMDILKTFDLHKNRPWILCIESDQDDFSPYAKHPLIDFLSERDYIPVANSGINYIFIAREHFSLQSFIWS